MRYRGMTGCTVVLTRALRLTLAIASKTPSPPAQWSRASSPDDRGDTFQENAALQENAVLHS